MFHRCRAPLPDAPPCQRVIKHQLDVLVISVGHVGAELLLVLVEIDRRLLRFRDTRLARRRTVESQHVGRSDEAQESGKSQAGEPSWDGAGCELAIALACRIPSHTRSFRLSWRD